MTNGNMSLRNSRSRILLQQKLTNSGLNNLSDQEIIELILNLTLLPRQSRRLAPKCLEKFESLRGFLAASPKELEQLGLTDDSIFSINLVRELPAEILKRQIQERPFSRSSQEIFDYLAYSMRDLKKELLKVIFLNNQNQIINTVDLFEGTLEEIFISPRAIVESAIENSATALIFAHNHPSGNPKPSKSDKQFTRDLVFIGNVIQVKVLDHIIIGSSNYFSFVDAGLIKKYETDFLDLKIRSLLTSQVTFTATWKIRQSMRPRAKTRGKASSHT